MTAAVAGLLEALIGAIAGLLGALLTSFIQSRHEKQKWFREQQGILSKELRTQIAEVSRHMLSAQHSMEWITWYAREGADHISKELITNYEREIHMTFPELLGALTIIASFDIDIYDRLASLAEELYALDEKILKALLLFDESPQESAIALSEIYPYAT